MNNNTFESLIGAIVLILAFFFVIYVSKIVNLNRDNSNTYKVYANFNNIEGINIGSEIKIAGVKIGNVSDIILNKDTYKAELILTLPNNILIPTDSIFKIATSGIIGNKFIDVKVGSSEDNLKNKDIVEFTESVINLEDLISQYIFNKKNN